MSETQLEIPEEIQVAVIGDFLQTAAGQGVQTLIQLTVPGVRDTVRLNAALALTGMYDQYALEVEEAYDVPDQVPYEVPDQVPYEVPADADFLEGGDVEREVLEDLGPEGPRTPVEQEQENVISEEAAARLQALSNQAPAEEADEGAGSMGGASGIGKVRNAKATRRRRKHGR